MALGNVSEATEESSSEEADIPPAIACAHCGRGTCEGCAPEPEPAQPPRLLPWESDQGGVYRRLVETAELTACLPEAAFGKLGRGSMTRAWGFAFLCEIWAVGSFSVVWGTIFYSVFPLIAARMATSASVLLLATSILFTLVVFVVLVHALWGLWLEWGIARSGRAPDWNLGLRFGLYACGWDFLTSPAGYLSQVNRHGYKRGWAGVRAGARAPRPSLNAYLDGCRNLSPGERRIAVRTAIVLGSLAALFVGSALFGALLAYWVPEIFG